MSRFSISKNMIALLVLIATSFLTAPVNADEFAVQEGDLLYYNSDLSTPNATELLFLDAASLEAYQTVYPNEDFEADIADVTDLATSRRLIIGRKLPGTNWGGAIRYGGRCQHCSGSRRLRKGRRMTANDPVLAAEICDNLANGPFPIFHGVSDCEVYLEYA